MHQRFELNIKTVFTAVILWGLILVVTTLVSISVDQHQSLPQAIDSLARGQQESIWSRWNRAIYEDIARNGYTFSGPDIDFGFWPLWPLIIRLVLVIVPTVGLAATAATLIVTLMMCWLLYRLVSLDEEPRVARDALLWSMVAPVSFIFFMPFNEALFLLGVVLTFYAGRRGHWFLAGLAAAGVMLTRHVGFFLLIPLAIEWWSQRVHDHIRMSSLVSWLGLSLLGAAIFPFYAFMHTNNLFAAFDYQRVGFGHDPSQPVTELWRYIVSAGRDPVSAVQFILFLLGALGVVWCVRLARRGRLRVSYAWYAALLFLFPMFSSDNLIGIPRYTIVLFPLYILLAKTIRRPSLSTTLMVASFVLQLLFFWLYLRDSLLVM